jgi:tetratricopeptide (TPR) repeat protein
MPYAKLMLGFCYYRMRDYRHAWEFFDSFTTGKNKDVISLFYRGVILHKEGKNEEALEAFDLASSYIEEGTLDKMLVRINKAMLLDLTGNSKSAEDALSMALMMRPKEARLLIFHDSHMYEPKCKECMTFEEMDRSDYAGWNEAEELLQLGIHLVKYNHMALAKRVFTFMLGFYDDQSDIYAYIAYTAWHTGYKEQTRNAAEMALEGKSFLLFDLFGVPYNAGISTEEFMNQITSRG